MKALVILGHPDPASLNHALAHALAQAWEEAGCEVEFHDLYAEGFDPVITAKEARGEPADDPAIRAHVESLMAADLLGVVHPNYWGAPPAMMKGWVDRAFASGAAYDFEKGATVPDGLLKVREAVVLNTGNTPPDREHGHFGDPLDRVWGRCILDFCGVERVERRLYSVTADSEDDQRAEWIAEAGRLAREAHARAA